jgi:hypothetical protein
MSSRMLESCDDHGVQGTEPLQEERGYSRYTCFLRVIFAGDLLSGFRYTFVIGAAHGFFPHLFCLDSSTAWDGESQQRRYESKKPNIFTAHTADFIRLSPAYSIHPETGNMDPNSGGGALPTIHLGQESSSTLPNSLSRSVSSLWQPPVSSRSDISLNCDFLH